MEMPHKHLTKNMHKKNIYYEEYFVTQYGVNCHNENLSLNSQLKAFKVTFKLQQL